MNKRWSFYVSETGRFLDLQVAGPDGAQWQFTPDGCVAVEGSIDHLSKVYDKATGQIVDWKPPQPDEHHEWSEADKRWVLTTAAAASARAHDAALSRIKALEAKQARPLRELAMAGPGANAARAVLTSIEADISALRQSLLSSPPRKKHAAVPSTPAVTPEKQAPKALIAPPASELHGNAAKPI